MVPVHITARKGLEFPTRLKRPVPFTHHPRKPCTSRLIPPFLQLRMSHPGTSTFNMNRSHTWLPPSGEPAGADAVHRLLRRRHRRHAGGHLRNEHAQQPGAQHAQLLGHIRRHRAGLRMDILRGDALHAQQAHPVAAAGQGAARSGKAQSCRRHGGAEGRAEAVVVEESAEARSVWSCRRTQTISKAVVELCGNRCCSLRAQHAAVCAGLRPCAAAVARRRLSNAATVAAAARDVHNAVP